ncbi:hypothetical protein [Plantibacter sp. Leaf314]|uniref:hypothetical protein n=1 Tax=Plantibacter sp. Leaf314 TaxID=1736333 RepID=UPI00070083B2|nr:hypothetical protein [Plantibacter sp. Leaf314]KQQ51988.1 hypothetical protein ASF68_06210 [Plantibacter sp. Leaf314]
MANWTADTPGQIDSGSLATTATTLQTTETSLTEARDTAVTAQGGITDSIWSGEAATAWVNSLSTPIGKINAVVPEMAAVRAAIATYTTTVEDIRTRATSYKETIVQATLLATVQYMDAIGGPDPAQQALRDEQHQTALNDKAKAESLLEALSTEREEADAQLVTALSTPGGDNWDAQQAALAAIGITSAAGLTPDAIAKGMAELGSELAKNGIYDAEDAAKLQSLYALYGNDPVVMSKMNLAMGGEDVISLINAIDKAGADGWLAPGAALLLAQSVRGGLSVGSQRWNEETGDKFAQELYDGSASVHGTDSWTSLAFLFGDEQGNPIGVTTTVGLADIADEMERGNPGSSAGMYGPGQGIMGPNGFLSLAEAEQAGYDVNRLGDWTSRVFSTLGEYPEAAMDWLTSTETDPYFDSPQYASDPNLSAAYDSDKLGANRIDYWFGRRDSGLDGFEGVLALWAGAESIPGGPTDAGTYSEDAWKQAAKLSHDVIYQLVGEPKDSQYPPDPDEFRPGNPHFQIENVSDLGGVKLAAALAPQIPGLIEDPIVSPSGERPSTGGPIANINAYGIAVDANGDPVAKLPYANVSPAALAQILGIAGSSSGGAEALTIVLDDYRDVLIGATELGAYAPADAATRLAFVQDVLAGSTDGVDLAAATRRDEAVDSAIGLVETGVGMLPIPGLDKLIGSVGDELAEKLLSEGAGYVRGQLTDAATGAVSDIWAGSHDDVEAAISDGALTRSQSTQIQIARTLFEFGAVPGVEPPPASDPVAQYAWVEEHRDDFDKAFTGNPNGSLDLNRVAGDADARYSLFRGHAEG